MLCRLDGGWLVAGWLVAGWFCRLADWLIGCLVVFCCLFVWLVGWLVSVWLVLFWFGYFGLVLMLSWFDCCLVGRLVVFLVP